MIIELHVQLEFNTISEVWYNWYVVVFSYFGHSQVVIALPITD